MTNTVDVAPTWIRRCNISAPISAIPCADLMPLTVVSPGPGSQINDAVANAKRVWPRTSSIRISSIRTSFVCINDVVRAWFYGCKLRPWTAGRASRYVRQRLRAWLGWRRRRSRRFQFTQRSTTSFIFSAPAGRYRYGANRHEPGRWGPFPVAAIRPIEPVWIESGAGQR